MGEARVRGGCRRVPVAEGALSGQRAGLCGAAGAAVARGGAIADRGAVVRHCCGDGAVERKPEDPHDKVALIPAECNQLLVRVDARDVLIVAMHAALDRLIISARSQ